MSGWIQAAMQQNTIPGGMVWIKPHQKYHYVCTIWIEFDALLNKMNQVEGFSAGTIKMMIFCRRK